MPHLYSTICLIIGLNVYGLLFAGPAIPPVSTNTQALSQLILNEFLADPPQGIAGDANGDGTRAFQEDEFVEFFNNGPLPLDLSGFKLWDLSTVRHIFPSGTVLAPYQALVVFGRPSVGGNQGDFGLALVQNCSQCVIGAGDGLSLTNGWDRIALTTPQDSIVLSYTYGAADIDQSFTRFPDLTVAEPNRPHQAASTEGLLFSPGRTVNGTPFFLRTPRFEQEILMVNEGVQTITLDISLDGVAPVSDSTISVEVFLVSGDAADLNGFQRQTVVFPAGTDVAQQIDLMIRDDSLQEGEEIFVLKFANLQGDANAALDGTDSLVLHILDNDQSIQLGFERGQSELPHYRQGTHIPVEISQTNFLEPIEVIIALSEGDGAVISNFTADTLQFMPGSSARLDLPITFTPGISLTQAIRFKFDITQVTGTNRNGIPLSIGRKTHVLTIQPNTGTHFYYIDPLTGNDSNDGRSPATAWETLFNINLGDNFSPNSRILLKADSYFSGQ